LNYSTSAKVLVKWHKPTLDAYRRRASRRDLTRLRVSWRRMNVTVNQCPVQVVRSLPMMNLQLLD